MYLVGSREAALALEKWFVPVDATIVGVDESADVALLKVDPAKSTVARVLFAPKHLCIAFHCAEADTDAIKAAVKDRDGDVYTDDCVEIFVSPDVEEEGYYHFIINPAGTV